MDLCGRTRTLGRRLRVRDRGFTSCLHEGGRQVRGRVRRSGHGRDPLPEWCSRRSPGYVDRVVARSHPRRQAGEPGRAPDRWRTPRCRCRPAPSSPGSSRPGSPRPGSPGLAGWSPACGCAAPPPAPAVRAPRGPGGGSSRCAYRTPRRTLPAPDRHRSAACARPAQACRARWRSGLLLHRPPRAPPPPARGQLLAGIGRRAGDRPRHRRQRHPLAAGGDERSRSGRAGQTGCFHTPTIPKEGHQTESEARGINTADRG
jgi:hypothetical protein